MLFGRYEFRCRFNRKARLPVYKGSTFRGAFGHALKSVVCTLKRQECEICMLKTQCIYTLVFETHLARSLPDGIRVASAPHPFVIEPPLTTQADFNSGEPFNFSLLLFGDVNHHLPYLIYAFDRMGRLGLGKRINGHRGRFFLETVAHDNQVIYSSDHQVLQMEGDQIPHLSLADSPKDANEKKRLKISLTTPLRLKFKNNFTAKLPFHILVRAMLRRASTLLTFYDGGEPQLDYRGIVERAKAVKVIASDSRWFSWERFSQRQNQKMPFGGLTGTVTYEGALGEFVPLVKFCENAHIGKQTAFGLGKISAAE
jgi:CRISPR-associated endoribonuclease Cas6